MAGKLRPSLRAKTLHNVMNRSNLSDSDKKCIQDVFESYKNTSEWISVKDRLPETSDYYLVVCAEYGFYNILHFSAFHQKFNVYDWNHSEFVDIEAIDITHWTPLPKLPKEGGVVANNDR